MNSNSGSGALVISGNSTAPHKIARSLFTEISLLDKEIEESKKRTEDISKKFFLSRWFSHSEDQVAASERQNSINIKLMRLIERHIELNVLSVAALTTVLDDFRGHVSNGFKDSHGNTALLSENGKKLANSMSSLILGVIQSAERTRDSIGSIESHISSSTERLDHVELKLSIYGEHIEKLSIRQDDVRRIGERSVEELSNLAQKVNDYALDLLSTREGLLAGANEASSQKSAIESLALDVSTLQKMCRRQKIISAVLFLVSWAALAYLAFR